jgi:hypothetical protein
VIAGGVRGQENLSLEQALGQSAEEIRAAIPENSKTAVLSIATPSPALDDYILAELEALLVNSRSLDMVDRRELDLIRQEELYQMSGEVSEETARRIGAKIGAQFIISGSLVPVGNVFRLRIKILEVETARIPGIVTLSITADKTIRDLLKNDAPAIPAAYRADSWKHKRLYLGGRGGLSLGFYDNSGGLLDKTVYLSQSIKGDASYNAALYGAVSLLDFLEVQLEAALTGDSFDLYSGKTLQMEVSWNSLMIPLLLKLSYRPSVFVLQGFLGPYLNIPLGQLTVKHRNGSYTAGISDPAGFMAGIGLGVKLGPGAIIGDIRYAGDFSALTANYSGSKSVARCDKLSFSLGYEIGVIDKR